MEKNLKVMEAAYNFTDAVIEDRCYSIEKGYHFETFWINIEYKNSKIGLAMYDVRYDVFMERLPIHYAQQQFLKAECLKYDNVLKAAEQREKEIKEEFEAWRKNNGK